MGRKRALKKQRRTLRGRGNKLSIAPEPRFTCRVGAPTSGNWTPDDNKLSSRLHRVAQPLVENMPKDAPLEHRELAYQIAALAWNCSLPKGVGAPTSMPRMGDLVEPEISRLLEAFKTRKRELFPEDTRMIIDVAVYPRDGDEVYVEVASATWA